jgi:nucleotide-binding universal stress UspA family protein
VNILVAVDLSDASKRVIAVAGKVAAMTGSKVFVLHCAEPDPAFVGYEAGPDAVRDQVAAEYREEHRAVQALASELEASGVDATGLLVQGPVAETVLSEAERLDAGLVIVGSHGHGAVYDLLVGSHSAGILKRSDLPVLVVPTRRG